MRWYTTHLAVLLLALLMVQSTRLSESLADLVEPAFQLEPGFPDFDRAYYPGAQIIRRDPLSLYTRDPIFTNIPLVAWLFVPLTWLPLEWAGRVVLLLNVSLSLVCLLVIQRRVSSCSSAHRWAITFAFATSGPLIRALNTGQTTLLILLLLLLAEGCLHARKDRLAGIWLGLACVIKIPPLLFLPYLALRRRWWAVLSAATVVLLAMMLSIVSFGVEANWSYVENVILKNANVVRPLHNNQSLNGFLARMMTDGKLVDSIPIVPSRTLRTISLAFVSGLIMVIGFLLPLRGRGMRTEGSLVPLELGTVMCASLIVFPITWIHYSLWLLPVYAILGCLIISGGSKGLLRCGSGLLLVIGVSLINFPALPTPILVRFDQDIWFRLFVSHHFVGTLILLGLCLWFLLRRRAHTNG